MTTLVYLGLDVCPQTVKTMIGPLMKYCISCKNGTCGVILGSIIYLYFEQINEKCLVKSLVWVIFWQNGPTTNYFHDN